MYFERMAEAMGLTTSDMHTYGAEDMQELIDILDALDRASGITDPWLAPGGAWERLMSARRIRLGSLETTSIPLGPGALVLFDGSIPVFVGEGVGRRGLRGRIQEHRSTRPDLSSSTLRASVAVDLLGVSRWTARQRPSVLPADMIEEVNEAVADLDIAWIECASVDEARELRRQLWAEYKPEYNIL